MSLVIEPALDVEATGTTAGCLVLCLPESPSHSLRFHLEHEEWEAVAFGWLCDLLCLLVVDDGMLLDYQVDL